MILLPRAEALTGEVFCGSHRKDTWGGIEDGVWRTDMMCTKPANHPGSCVLVSVKAFRKIQVEEKAESYGPNDTMWDFFSYSWDQSPQPDATAYGIEHPDTRETIDVSKEDFMRVYNWVKHKSTGAYYPEDVDFVREVLKPYV
jgi:hypothetical protein